MSTSAKTATKLSTKKETKRTRLLQKEKKAQPASLSGKAQITKKVSKKNSKKTTSTKNTTKLEHEKELKKILKQHTHFVPIEESVLFNENEDITSQKSSIPGNNKSFTKVLANKQRYSDRINVPRQEYFLPIDGKDGKVFKRTESLRTSHKHISLAFAALIILIIVGSYVSPKGSAESVTFYPTSCLGGWINPKMAEGRPEIEENKDSEKFSEGNSAILPSATNADIYCGGFVGEFKKNTKPTKVLVMLSWSKGYDVENYKIIEASSFASSTQEILDTNASTTVIFSNIETPGVNQQATTTSSSIEILETATTTDSETKENKTDGVITPDSTSTLRIPDGALPLNSGSTTPEKQMDGTTPSTSAQQEQSPVEENNKSIETTTPTQTTEPSLINVIPELPQSPALPLSSPISFLNQLVRFLAFGNAMDVYAEESPLTEEVPPKEAPQPVAVPDTVQPSITSTPILDSVLETVSKTDALISNENTPNTTLLQKADELLSKKIELPDISSTTLFVATETIPTNELFDSNATTSFSLSVPFVDSISSSTFMIASSTDFSLSETGTTTLIMSASSTIVNVSANAEDESPNNFLELMYTFDGITWASLGKVNEDSIVYRTFEIPVATTTSWDDISALQIKVKYNGRIDPTPAIYLDGIKVEALYETPVEHEHPDFARDTILKDKSDDNVRVISIINGDTNAREIWYTTIREQGDFGVEPGSWVKLNFDQDKISYRLVEIYGRYLFWVDDIGKMLWTMNLEKNTNDGIILNKNGTTTIPFIKSNGEQWYFDYNNERREGVLRIQQ